MSGLVTRATKQEVREVAEHARKRRNHVWERYQQALTLKGEEEFNTETDIETDIETDPMTSQAEPVALQTDPAAEEQSEEGEGDDRRTNKGGGANSDGGTKKRGGTTKGGKK